MELAVGSWQSAVGSRQSAVKMWEFSAGIVNQAGHPVSVQADRHGSEIIRNNSCEKFRNRISEDANLAKP
jgi:hypothetical protein